MTLYAGDALPTVIEFPISTGTVDGTLVSSARASVRLPNESVQFWTLTIGTKTAGSVATTYPLAADGSSVPEHGTYKIRAFLYASGGALLLVTDETEFEVQRTACPRPPT